MLISHRHKFIFLKTRKTAGTSIEISLSRYLGEEDVITPISPADESIRAAQGAAPRNWRGRFNPFPTLLTGSPREVLHALRDLLKGRRFRNHEPAVRVRARVDSRVWKSYFKFCFERNPWDKCVSHYFWNQGRRGGDGSTFPEYVAAGDLPVDHWRYMDRRGLVVDFVGRMENLGEDLAKACGIIGLPFDGWLPRAKADVRPPESRPFQRFVDEASRRRIERAFAREIALLGYRFEERGRPALLLRPEIEADAGSRAGPGGRP